MAAPGGVPSSLEHTLVLKLTVLMNDAPALYAKVPHFVKTDLRLFSRNYDRIRSELLAHKRDILASSALSRRPRRMFNFGTLMPSSLIRPSSKQ